MNDNFSKLEYFDKIIVVSDMLKNLDFLNALKKELENMSRKSFIVEFLSVENAVSEITDHENKSGPKDKEFYIFYNLNLLKQIPVTCKAIHLEKRDIYNFNTEEITNFAKKILDIKLDKNSNLSHLYGKPKKNLSKPSSIFAIHHLFEKNLNN